MGRGVPGTDRKGSSKCYLDSHYEVQDFCPLSLRPSREDSFLVIMARLCGSLCSAYSGGVPAPRLWRSNQGGLPAAVFILAIFGADKFLPDEPSFEAVRMLLQ